MSAMTWRAMIWRTARNMALLRDPFGKYVRAAATMLGGLALGFGLTAMTLRNGYGFGEVQIGPWITWPSLGEADIDPYARAALARRGVAPLGRSEGVAFLAQVDSAGAPLESRCDYVISGAPPAARFWTLGLTSPAGAPLENPTQRYAFTSSNVLRRDGGGFEITVAKQARPGNWLSPGEARGFAVTLRLYDAAFDAAARPDPAHFLSIVKMSCA
jgi:hypothetical protein